MNNKIELPQILNVAMYMLIYSELIYTYNTWGQICIKTICNLYKCESYTNNQGNCMQMANFMMSRLIATLVKKISPDEGEGLLKQALFWYILSAKVYSSSDAMIDWVWLGCIAVPMLID